ncbi:hypothetical protein [Polyangium sp. 6x1]|uniref:hypothetical protein n=1 Tax=Polyangium sp. 6x1 TaxID=3042689 RepID=UPI0024822A4B|nr:hypothetical protein [Polyangium sp. 6x1]MDI1445576.1 hypothetical protein [Polyangium sp. 6x1]
MPSTRAVLGAKVLSIGAALMSLTVTTSLYAAETSFPAPKTESSGFAFGTNMSLALVDEQDDHLREELWVGYKFANVLLGVSGYFSTRYYDAKYDTGNETHVKEETFLIGPEAQFVLHRSAKARVEVLGLLGAAAGTWRRWRSHVDRGWPVDIGDPVTTVTSDQGIRVRWHLGPGVRFWPSPAFGIHLAGGALGDYRLIGSNSITESPINAFFQAGFVGVTGVPTKADTEKQARAGSPTYGVALQAGISTSPRANVDGNLGLGFSAGRFLIALGVDVPRIFDFEETIANAELQFTTFRSDDRRLELFLSGAVGHSVVDSTMLSTFRWRAAPGVRFWAAPGVALTGAVGVLGDHDEINTGDEESERQYITMFWRAGLLSVFGL